MNKKRLLMLADFLESKKGFKDRGVIPAKFDLEHWMAPYSKFENPRKFVKTKPSKKKKFDVVDKITIKLDFYEMTREIVQPVECQTAGCAVGWAATIPEFNKEGFYLTTICGIVQPLLTVKKRYYVGFEAVERFFGIDNDTVEYLFQKWSYKEDTRGKPEIVAKRIREFVKTGLPMKKRFTS